MNQEQALNILIQGIRKANVKGAFELEESAALAQAVAVFTTPPAQEPAAVRADEVVKEFVAEQVKEVLPV